MAELFHVFIRPNPDVTSAQIEKQLDLAADWLKYTDGCYLVFTTRDIDVLSGRLKPLVVEGGNLLILNVDPYQYKGWMPKSVWPWLKEKKGKMFGDA